MSADLKQQTIRGLIWSAIEKFGVKIISFLSNIFLARMLSPDDYGCIGMLAIFISISNAFIYGGFSSALIQKKNTTEEDYSTVFYWNLTISIIFYFLLFFFAPVIADFYKIPLLSDVLRVQGIILIINALCIIQITLLKKNLDFKKIASINVISSFLSLVIALICAYLDFGVWTLVLQQLCCGVVSVSLLWVKSNWRPCWVFSKKSFKELFSYGSFQLLSELLNSFVDNVQGLIIGRKFSAETMGYYSQAKKLEEIPTTSISQIVQQVSFPVFSKIQDDKDKLYAAVKKSLSSMNFINIPLMVLLFIIAEPLIVVLFSDKWLPSVPYFRILCIAGIVNCAQSVNYQVVAASGRSKDIFKWNVVKRITGIILIVGSIKFGVTGILYAMTIGFYFTYIVNAIVATQTTGYTIFAQIKDTLPIMLVSILSAVIPWLIGNMDFNYIALLCLQVVVFVVSYGILSKIFKIQALSEYVDIIKGIVRNRKND